MFFKTFRSVGRDPRDWFYTAESPNFGTEAAQTEHPGYRLSKPKIDFAKVGKISGKTSYGKGFNFGSIKKRAKHFARAVGI
ncbi:hypothetical protein [Alistipes finegoldii]|uniref:hypothetical protein n=1 Tax=Alistipes finegoldii TaxID=214856 RepID=UPI003AB21AD8